MSAEDDLVYELALIYDPSQRLDKPYYVALHCNGTEKELAAYPRAYFATEEQGVQALDARLIQLRCDAQRRKERKVIKSVRV